MQYWSEFLHYIYNSRMGLFHYIYNSRMGLYLEDHRALHIQVDPKAHLNLHHLELQGVLTM